MISVATLPIRPAAVSASVLIGYLSPRRQSRRLRPAVSSFPCARTAERSTRLGGGCWMTGGGAAALMPENEPIRYPCCAYRAHCCLAIRLRHRPAAPPSAHRYAGHPASGAGTRVCFYARRAPRWITGGASHYQAATTGVRVAVRLRRRRSGVRLVSAWSLAGIAPSASTEASVRIPSRMRLFTVPMGSAISAAI